MIEVYQALLVLMFLMVFYFILGIIVNRIFKLDCDKIFEIVIGYIICMVIFQIIAIPLQIMKVSLTMLTCVYVTILALFLVGILYLTKKERIKSTYEKINRQNVGWILIIILVQVLFVFLNMYNGSIWDSSHYNGEIVTAWATDTMRIFDQYTGKEMVFNWRECIFTYEMHSAAMCRLFDIHPMIYVHRVLASLEIIIYNIIIYNIGLLLFKNDAQKATMVCGISLIVNTYTNSIFLTSSFLWYRAGESKSMLANIVLPLMLYWIIQLNIEDRWNVWMMLLLSVVMGAGISGSAVFIMPILLTICIVPLFLKKKDVKVLAKYIMCLLPCLLYIIIG